MTLPAKATRAYQPKDAAEGWRAMRTPAKPTTIAAHRRQPTGSPRNSAAPGTTQSGVVYASTTERPVGTVWRPMLDSTPKPTMCRSVMLASTGRSWRGGRTS